MSDDRAAEDLVEFIAKALVDDTDAVEVHRSDDGRTGADPLRVARRASFGSGTGRPDTPDLPAREAS